jgi:hypothetical protein
MTFYQFIDKVDSYAPREWVVEGVRQAPLSEQLAGILGILIGLVIYYFIL